MFRKIANDIANDFSLNLIIQLLAFLLSVPGTFRHLLLNLLVLPRPLFLLLVFCFRFMEAHLGFQTILQTVKNTDSQLQAH